MNLLKFFTKGNKGNIKNTLSEPLTDSINRGNLKDDLSEPLTEFINRGNVNSNLPDGQATLERNPNIFIQEFGEITPYQAVILNNFLKQSGYTELHTEEVLYKLGLREVIKDAIREGSDFTPYLRDALKNDSVALAAFDESLKQAASYDNILQTMNTSKAKLARAKAREEQAATLYEIKKQTEQANRNAKFIKKYGVPYSRFNAFKEATKDALWRSDKNIYNKIKNMDNSTKLIGWNMLNASSPYIWQTPILEEIFGDRPLKDWGQAAQMASTGYMGSKWLGGASNKAAAIAAMAQALFSLGASSYLRQNQNKPNNIENQEKPIEYDLDKRSNKSLDNNWGLD